MCIRIYAYAHNPCSGAYVCIVESSVVYSVDTVGNR